MNMKDDFKKDFEPYFSQEMNKNDEDRDVCGMYQGNTGEEGPDNVGGAAL